MIEDFSPDNSLIDCQRIGRPGVDRHIQHEAEIAVIQVLFLINEVGSAVNSLLK